MKDHVVDELVFAKFYPFSFAKYSYAMRSLFGVSATYRCVSVDPSQYKIHDPDSNYSFAKDTLIDPEDLAFE